MGSACSAGRPDERVYVALFNYETNNGMSVLKWRMDATNTNNVERICLKKPSKLKVDRRKPGRIGLSK